jgi:SAM-dependent methyltransferase
MKIKFSDDLVCPLHIEAQKSLKLVPLCVVSEHECVEGFLECQTCDARYPIIEGVAIILPDFAEYVGNRTRIYGKWLLNSRTPNMRDFLRDVGHLLRTSSSENNRYEEEGIWFASYKWIQYDFSEKDRFLNSLKRRLKPTELYNRVIHEVTGNVQGIALDLGCSMGYTVLQLARKYSSVIGIDLSYSFIKEARKKMAQLRVENTEFCVSDALRPPFRRSRFDLILALNLLELTNPVSLLSSMHWLLKPHASGILTDPYDFKREPKPHVEFTGRSFRTLISNSGFKIIGKNPNDESFIPWILKISERTYLYYFVDLIRVNKISKHKYNPNSIA